MNDCTQNNNTRIQVYEKRVGGGNRRRLRVKGTGWVGCTSVNDSTIFAERMTWKRLVVYYILFKEKLKALN